MVLSAFCFLKCSSNVATMEASGQDTKEKLENRNANALTRN